MTDEIDRHRSVLLDALAWADMAVRQYDYSDLGDDAYAFRSGRLDEIGAARRFVMELGR